MTNKAKGLPNVRRMWIQGLHISIGTPLGLGGVLRIANHEEAVRAISNLLSLAGYGEVEFVHPSGGLSTYIATDGLISNPQVFLGYGDATGFPLLLGVKGAMEGHLTIIGPTRCGKSTTIGSMSFQLSSLGFPVFVVGIKSWDPVLLASLKLACDALTRGAPDGKPKAVPFTYFSLQSGIKTGTFNYHAQTKPSSQAQWSRAGMLVQALMPGGSASDATKRYFETYAQKLLQSFDWGASFREQHANATKVKQDRDAKYATAGIINEILRLASIEQANPPTDDPVSIKLDDVMNAKGSIYFDCSFQEVGATATAFAAIVVLAIISVKRAIWPGREKRIVIFIDEAQMFPRGLLKQLIEQAAGSGIVLVLAYHTLEQMGEDWETISMTQARMIFGAVPGGLTDRHLQSLFGTHTVYRKSFSETAGIAIARNYGVAHGPSGSTFSEGLSIALSRNSNFGLTEVEEPVWTPNHTLELNDDRDQFVLQVSPGAEYAQFGPGALLARRGGTHLSFDIINQTAEDVLKTGPLPSLPTTHTPALIQNSTATQGDGGRRATWQNAFIRMAENVQNQLK